jgi:hypothetical protein
MRTAGINQQTSGIIIKGKKEAAYSPVIWGFPILQVFQENLTVKLSSMLQFSKFLTKSGESLSIEEFEGCAHSLPSNSR